MSKKLITFIFIAIITISSSLFGNENLLTLQQQVERLQREVSDISKSLYSDDTIIQNNSNENVTSNLSAIDMRIYDLEKDIKNLTANIEELFFKIDDVLNEFDKLKSNFNNFNNVKNDLTINQTETNTNNDNQALEGEDKSLGTLKISPQNNDDDSEEAFVENDTNEENFENLSTEDQFQKSLEFIRNKKYDEAKSSFELFIKNNPENQLSGSAHYWLGELYILEKKYRDAAIIFAEGYQNFPKSIKAPDMLFKLAESLFNVQKNQDACKTLEKFILDFPNHKLVKKTKKISLSSKCINTG